MPIFQYTVSILPSCICLLVVRVAPLDMIITY